MKIKIANYRITKKGNIAFQTKYGEFFLDVDSDKCRLNFLRYFPHLQDEVTNNLNGEFDPDRLIGQYCHGYPIIEPMRN